MAHRLDLYILYHRTPLWLLFKGVVAIILICVSLSPAAVLAQISESRSLCYSVASGVGDDADADTLVALDLATGDTHVVGALNTLDVEAIALSPDGQTLYAADGDRLGKVELQTGMFRFVGSFGRGNGRAGAQLLDDVDGLTYDITTDTLFGVHRRPNGFSDLLFKINPITGAALADGFGDGIDYVEIPITTAGNDDVVDIAADPFTGILYGMVDRGNLGSMLVTIDKENGAITELGVLRVNDMAGLGFFSNGSAATLYGSTGDNGSESSMNNKLYRIDKRDGHATFISSFLESPSLESPMLRDYESLDCLTLPAGFGGAVWADLNQNGVQDLGELPLPDMTVNLWTDDANNGTPDTQIDSTTTNAAGLYEFINLDPALDYIVQFDLPSGFRFTQLRASSTTVMTLSVGEFNSTVDAGVVSVASDDGGSGGEIALTESDMLQLRMSSTLGNFVWRDRNANGLQDDDEVGMANVTVNLLDADGNAIDSVLTDAEGFYVFENLSQGEYVIEVELPVVGYYLFSPLNAGDSAVDSDLDELTGRTNIIQLDAGESDLTLDAGIWAPPLLEVDKTANVAVARPGDIITYTITYANDGSGDATGVVIVESVPEFTLFLPEASAPEWVCEDGQFSAGTICQLMVGDLPAGERNDEGVIFAVQIISTIPDDVDSILNQLVISDDGLNGTAPGIAPVVDVVVELAAPTGVETGPDPETGLQQQENVFLPLIGRRNLKNGLTIIEITVSEKMLNRFCALATNFGFWVDFCLDE